jgi:acyl-CoA hydrolase
MSEDWAGRVRDKTVTADEAVSGIRRGQRVFIGSGAAEPQLLVKALADRGESLADNQIIHIRSLGVAPYTESKFSDRFRYNSFFIGDNVRDAVAACRADYTPVFLSEVPRLFRSGRAPVDAALIQVTPPDAHGFCSYGVSVDIVKAATESARLVVAELNPQMPRTLGDSFIHIDRIHRVVLQDAPILEIRLPEADEVSRRIGTHIADLVEDGATIQMGIGTIPDSVLSALSEHRDLGVHTEMVSDGIVSLIEKGVVNGTHKTLHRGKVVASFALGTSRLYRFIHDNPMFEFYPNEYSNDPFVISRNRKMVAINAALEVDLTGQVCSDSLGTYFYSGIGGQVDFVRGAARSEGGRPVIALPSTVMTDGQRHSRIVSILKPGAGVVTSRGDVHWVVTEYGAADLHGKSIRERAMALIHIAHPDYREDLMRDARDRQLVYADQIVVPDAGSAELDELETEMTTPGGLVVRFRPIEPTDERMLQDMFYQCSEQTIYMRFFTHLKAFPHRQAQAFLDVDYEDRLALVAITKEGERDAMVAVGLYSRDPTDSHADCAFIGARRLAGQGDRPVSGEPADRGGEVPRRGGIRGGRARAEHADDARFPPVRARPGREPRGRRRLPYPLPPERRSSCAELRPPEPSGAPKRLQNRQIDSARPRPGAGIGHRSGLREDCRRDLRDPGGGFRSR